MTITSSSALLALALTTSFGCGLIQLNGKSLGGGGVPSLADAESPSDSISPISIPSAGGKRLADIARPSETVPVTSWTPGQQYLLSGEWGSGVDADRVRDALGFDGAFGSVVLADELGGKLSQLGRISMIEECLGKATPDVTAAIRWAVCGEDLRSVDLAGAAAELRAEGLGGTARDKILAYSKLVLAAAAKVGAAVEAVATDDPGVAAILAAGKAARAEWKAYAGAHRDVIANVALMQGAARSGKPKDFAGCAEKTRPAFEKIVRAKKFTTEDYRDPLVYYANQLRADLDSHMTTLAWAACAAGLDESAEGLYAAIGVGEVGEVLRGERTLTLAKLYAPSFKPKFADRKLSLSDMRSSFRDGYIKISANPIAAIRTPRDGTLSKVTTAGDRTTLSFKGDKVDKCLEWRDGKMTKVSDNGDITYEQVCVRRGWVPNQTGDEEIATAFAAGLAPGMSVTTVNGFPVAADAGGKLRVVLGVALK